MSVKNKTSLAFGGHEFHVHDYVLYSSCDGPGDIGQIVSFDFPRNTSLEPIMVSMKRLGRISSLKEIIPEEEMIDERELFCSANHECNYNWVNAESLIQICHVVAAEYCSIGIENWILHSPDHFYVRYCFPSLNVKTWDSKRCITRKEKTTLRALDVFGECGAFGLALAEGSLSFDITHAIEIHHPLLNSPETTVLNICVNDAVRYIIKKNLNKNNLDDTPITKATGKPVEFSLRPAIKSDSLSYKLVTMVYLKVVFDSFLVASLPGTLLPEFPQPLYAILLEGVSPYLRINFVDGQTISPLHVLRSTLFPFVTVADAVSDLHWGHHGKEGRANIPTVPCQVHLCWWGLNNGENPYEHPARSRFQLQVWRNDVVTDIQHFTRKFPLKTVERVINVTSEPASDHQGLPPHLAQFQTWNPSAYFVKSSGNKSLYKRLNSDHYFMTTITNVSPTVKQSSVIHPFVRLS
ncbi:hypothetical protein BDP27DRAFT_1425938 [Rhodocollybia butyracea]|uniref:Uncharacterized protein n=1 Tax=Rhodocollybia butyracea TaxID=206335 RepID=A0A9P5PJ70_9AGAR|nr:hypothetical protein BDP27DRAFT_1425938 [Rhodocollybia butyracea]